MANSLVIDKDQFSGILSSWAQKRVAAILQVAFEEQISPFLIVALGEHESGWGRYLDQNMCGDSGHGHGYLQIDDRSFGTWLAQNNWKNDYINIKFGIQLFKKDMTFLSTNQQVPGLVEGTTVIVHAHAAQVRGCDPGTYTDPRPLQDSDLLYDTVASYNTGIGNVLMSVAVGVDADITTANQNYAKTVTGLANDLLAKYNAAGPAFDNSGIVG
jgi:hypothetical protein